MGLVASPSQYAQPADLANSGLLGTFTQGNTAQQITAALQSASAICDSYLRQQYKLPLSQWGPDLQQYTLWIAAYTLVQQRGYNPANPAEDTFATRYNQALAWLKDVAKGLATPAAIIDSSPDAADGSPTPAARPQIVSPGLAAGLATPTWETWARH